MTHKSKLAMALMASACLSTTAFAEINPDEIVVTATPIARATDEMVKSVSAMNAEEIARISASSLGELLQNEPGVTSSSFAPGASRPIIRGLDSFRVRVLENGAGAQDVSALSEDHGIPIDPLSVQRIEIIRGPAVLRYGSSAIGGAVSVLNDRVPTKVDTPFQGTFSMAVTPQEDAFEVGLLLDAGNENYGWHFDAYKRDSGDYEIPIAPGKQPNSGVTSKGFALGGSRILDTGHIGIAWSHFESDYGIPTSLEGPSEHGDILLDIEQDKLQVSGDWDMTSLISDHFQFEGALSSYTHNEIEKETGDIGSTFDNDEVELRGELTHEDRGIFSGAIGVQFRDRSLVASGEGGELLAPADMQSIALFLYEDIALGERLSLELGGRLERTKFTGTGVTPPTTEGVTLGVSLDTYGEKTSREFTPASVSAGLIFRQTDGPFGGINTGLTWQYVERAPDILELFAKGPHEASETFEIGLPSADKEKANALEFNIRREESPEHVLSFDLSVYRTEFDGFLYKYETGFVCGDEFDTCGVSGDISVDDELTQIQYAQKDATFKGYEANVAWRAAEWETGDVALGLRAEHVEAEFDDNKNLPRIPVNRYGASLSVHHGPFESRLGWLRAEKAKDLAPGETSTPGYDNLTADIAWRFEASDGKTFIAGLSGDNLLDEEIRLHTSFRKDGVVQPGRRIRLYIKSEF